MKHGRQRAASPWADRWPRLVALARAAAAMLGHRPDNLPIDSVPALERFVATRAAFVAQKTLYGYLRTRIGTRYPAMFEDDRFAASIDIAKYQVFAACLSDLVIFAVARACEGSALPDDARRDLAAACYRRAILANTRDAPPAFSPADSLRTFAARLAGTDWAFGALQRQNFTRSPKALLRWAPIAPELKAADAEIVENSIRFAWRDIREQLQKRLAPAAVVQNWQSPPGGPPGSSGP